MAMGSQQLAEDYRHLQALVALHPSLSILKTEGQPPETYEIEYRLRGYVSDETGGITIGEVHRVGISLPFGYPHFAPIAKPLTPIFHPDFDPAAIRIANRWQQNPSLAKLVLHIGEMICGAAYTLEEPFNQKAAAWYQAQQDQLPLDSLGPVEGEQPAYQPDARDDGQDDVRDDDGFANLGLEGETIEVPAQGADDAEITLARSLVAEKKFFTANQVLTDMAAKIHFPDREEMQQNIGKVLRKTDQLFKLAEQLEEAGKLEEALEVTDNLLTLAADAPGVATLRERIENSFLIARQLKTATRDKDDRGVNASKPPAKQPPASSAKPPARSVFFQRLPIKGILTAALLLLVAISALSLYFKDQNALSHSQASVLKGQLLLEKKDFESARASLETAKALLSDLTVLRYRKSPLTAEIDKLLTSPDLREGLQGRVRYQDQFLPAQTATALAELTILTDQAQSLVGQNKVDEALVLYRQALTYAVSHNLGPQQAMINDALHTLELQRTLVLAEKAEQGENWEEAAEAYRKALTHSGKLKALGTANDITQRLTAATFRHEMDQSKKAFTQSQWQETIRYLEHAQQAMDANPSIATNKERQDLRKLLFNSKLYLILSTAREAYQQKNWSLAIEQYQQALDLLAKAADSLEGPVGESIEKIEKTLMMVKIAQLQEKVLEAEGKTDTAAVITHSKEILHLIRSSSHGNDPAVKTVAQKITEKLEKQQETAALNEKIAWLEGHFEEIFRTHYPTFQNSKLSQPKAIFRKKVDNKSYFILTCLERSQGSSSKLELTYLFDSATGIWSVSHDQ